MEPREATEPWYVSPSMSNRLAHGSLGVCLFNNSKQAISAIQDNERSLRSLESLRFVKREDFFRLVGQERKYLLRVPEETPQDTADLDYFDIFVKVKQAECV